MSVAITKNIGMLLLAIYLILTGLFALLPVLGLYGIHVVLGLLAIGAGVGLLTGR